MTVAPSTQQRTRTEVVSQLQIPVWLSHVALYHSSFGGRATS